MNLSKKLIGFILALSVVIFLSGVSLSLVLHKFWQTLVGREALFISGVVCAFVFCSLFTKKWPENSLLICSISTFFVSTLFAGAAIFSSNIFESFLIPASFYVICLVGLLSALLVRIQV